MSFYRQCKLRRLNEVHIAWIPEEFAKLGKIIDLSSTGGVGWIVNEIWGERGEYLVRHERDHKTAFPSIAF